MPIPDPATKQLGMHGALGFTCTSLTVPPCPCRQHGYLYLSPTGPHDGSGHKQVCGETQVLLHLQNVPPSTHLSLQCL